MLGWRKFHFMSELISDYIYIYIYASTTNSKPTVFRKRLEAFIFNSSFFNIFLNNWNPKIFILLQPLHMFIRESSCYYF